MKLSPPNSLVSAVKFTSEKLLPLSIRKWILRSRQPTELRSLKKDIIKDLNDKMAINPDPDVKNIIRFLEKNPLHVFPYDFIYKYKLSDIKVYSDAVENLKYILYEGKRLYFKVSMSELEIKFAVRNLLIEQDKSSPHRYLAGSFESLAGKVAVDVGASEGIFSLSIIDKFERIYLFETDPEWFKPLSLTFKPFEDKVVLVNKFMDNKDDTHHCSFDKYFSDIDSVDLVKIDVDGAEHHLMEGAKGAFLKSKIKSVLLCTYHSQGDLLVFSNKLGEYGFTVQPSEGYMLFYHDKHFSAPYIRRGLIRARLNG